MVVYKRSFSLYTERNIMSTGNQELIRELNKNLVLKTLIQHSPISRADLAKECHLTKATISSIVQDLLDASLISEIGSGNAALGRKPILLEFCQTCGYVISIDIGVSSFTVLVSDLKGENCTLQEYTRKGFDITLDEISHIIEKTILKIPECAYGVVGICLGVYGVVNGKEVLFTPYYNLENKENFCQLLEDRFHIPFFIDNEANLCVLGESIHHYENKNIIYINVHSGIGAGILLNGQVFKGKKGYAGEIGHTILFPGGRPCPCGNNGCLEQYASERAILKDYADGKDLPSVTIEQFIRDYQEGDSLAEKLIEDFIQYMSICINNMIQTYNPELVILNSSFTNYIPGIREEISNRLKSINRDSVSLVVGETQDLSELVGGITICSNSFLKTNG